MQELLPAEQAVFNKLKQSIEDVYHRHGFISIETPIIDRTEVLFSKAGGDTEKQIYKVVKTDEATDDADQALRFDHTVPLARYVVQHENDLTFPFHVAQIGRNFRGERAQKGRFREFYQCDVDIIGRNELPIAYDAKVIATVYAALKTFDLPEMKVRISNRKVLSGFLQILNLSDKTSAISNIIDHAEKISPEQFTQALRDLDIPEENVVKITTFTNTHGTPDEIKSSLKTIIDTSSLTESLNELRTVYDLLVAEGLQQYILIDLMIVRGLDYYTGTVVETFLPEYRAIGSIASGGRYDNLASNFTDQKLPGVGVSIGLTRLFYILNQHGLLKTATEKPIDIAIIPITDNEHTFSIQLASKLRAQNKSVDVVLTDKKLGDKLAYAGKIAKSAIIIGESEVYSNNLQVKDLETGATSPLVLE